MSGWALYVFRSTRDKTTRITIADHDRRDVDSFNLGSAYEFLEKRKLVEADQVLFVADALSQGARRPMQAGDAAEHAVTRLRMLGRVDLTMEHVNKFVTQANHDCPACGEVMRQSRNPTGGDSWYFYCANNHQLWVGN